MKNPNGAGSTFKLPGKRRKPWAARVTVGWEYDEKTGKVKQKYAYLESSATKKEALQKLAEYNADPYDLTTKQLTFNDVYNMWSREHFDEIVPSATRTWISAYNHSKPLHKMKMRDIRVYHLEETIRNADVGQTTKARMKSLYNLMYRYAMKHEIVNKNYAELCASVKPGPKVIVRIPFSEAEIDMLWQHIDFPFVDMVLIGIYSGWRPQELATLRIEDIDLENHTFTGGSKTEAGKNRVVPIHHKIYPLVKKNYEKALDLKSDMLFNDENGQQGTKLTYDKYRGRFTKVMKRLQMAHRPHDTRHTFITLAKEAGMDEYILKLIVGHAIADVTEKVYTHRTIEQLKEEMEKI